MASSSSTLGGQSRVGGAVLVTPSGQAVGSTTIGTVASANPNPPRQSGGGGGTPDPRDSTPANYTPTPNQAAGLAPVPNAPNFTPANAPSFTPSNYTPVGGNFGLGGGMNVPTNTVAGQLQNQQSQVPYGGSPNIVTNAGTGIITRDQYGVQQSFGGKVKESFKAFATPSTVGEQGFSKYFDNIFSPFQADKNSAIRESARTELLKDSRQTSQGTIITPSLPYLSSSQDIYKLSPGEFKFAADVKSGLSGSSAGRTDQAKAGILADTLSSELQKSFQGESDYGQYTPNPEKYNETFQKTFQSGLKDISAQSKLGNEGLYTPVNVPKVAAQVGLFAATIPLARTSLGYSTLAVLSTGSSAPDYYKAFLGEGLTTTERLKEFGIGSLKVGVGILGINKGIGKTPKSLFAQEVEREIVTGKNSALNQELFQISGKELYKSDKGSFYNIKASRSVPGGIASQDIEFNLPVYRNAKSPLFGKSESGQPTLLSKGGEDLNFFITKGRSETRFFNFVTEKTTKSVLQFGGGGRVPTIGEGFKILGQNKLGKVSQEFKDVQTGLGSGYINVKGNDKTVETFKFFGITKEAKKVQYSLSGKPIDFNIPQVEKLSNKGIRSLFKNERLDPDDILHATFDPNENLISLNKASKLDIKESIRHELGHSFYNQKIYNRITPKIEKAIYKEIKSRPLFKYIDSLYSSESRGKKIEEVYTHIFQELQDKRGTDRLLLRAAEKTPTFKREFLDPTINFLKENNMKDPLEIFNSNKIIRKEIEVYNILGGKPNKLLLGQTLGNKVRGKLTSFGEITKLTEPTENLGLGSSVRSSGLRQTFKSTPPSPSSAIVERIGKIGIADFKAKSLAPQSSVFKTTYHGTSKANADRILKQGLQPVTETGIFRGVKSDNILSRSSVFVAEDEQVARGYANLQIAKGKSSQVLRIDLTKSQYETATRSFRGELEIEGSIPKNQISVVGRRPQISSRFNQLMEIDLAGNRFARPSFVTTSNLLQTQNQNINRRGLSLNAVRPSNFQSTSQRLSTAQTPALAQSQSFSLRTEQSFAPPSTPSTPTLFTPSFNPTFVPSPRLGGFGSPLAGFNEPYVRKKRKGRKGKYQYQSSFTASLLGITSTKKPKELSFGGYSALQPRAIIVQGRSRSKKRKGKR